MFGKEPAQKQSLLYATDSPQCDYVFIWWKVLLIYLNALRIDDQEQPGLCLQRHIELLQQIPIWQPTEEGQIGKSTIKNNAADGF